MPSYSRCVVLAMSAIVAILPARTAAVCAPASSTNSTIAASDAENLIAGVVRANSRLTASATNVTLYPDSTIMCISPVTRNASSSSADNIPRSPRSNPLSSVASSVGRKMCIALTKVWRIRSNSACCFRFPVQPLSCM